MARTNTLANFLTDVANAIRTKKGTEATIAASAFDTEILNLPSGTYQTKNITISANGSQTITPDQGYDAIDEITITTQVPQKQLQSKTYNFNTNQTVELTPDTGYDGFDIITLTINVPGQRINNQDKTITENGTYTADSGYTGLGTVTVNVPSGSGDVKLFETEQAMQADPSPSKGDLAIVKRINITPINVNSKLSTVKILHQVTLTSPITEEFIMCMFRNRDTYSELRFEYYDGNLSISAHGNNVRFNGRYTTEDGLTYTLNDYDTDQIIDIGCIVECEYPNEWNDIISLFISGYQPYFGGLFEYMLNYEDQSKVHFLLTSGLNIDSSDTITIKDNAFDSTYYDVETFRFLANKITEDFDVSMYSGGYMPRFFLQDGDLCFIMLANAYLFGSGLLIDTNYNTVGFSSGDLSIYGNVYVYKITDIDTGTYILKNTYTGIRGDNNSYVLIPNIVSCTIGLAAYNGGTISVDTLVCVYNNGSVQSGYKTIQDMNVYKHDDLYLPAKTQLDVTPDYVYEKTFYGKNGVENGILTTNVSNSFADVNAEVFAKLQQQYDNMQPRVLTDNDRTISRNIYSIPVKRDGTPLLDTSNVTNMGGMFDNCKNLATIPLLDTSNVTDMTYMFAGCSNLTTIPELNTSKIIGTYGMFNGCSSLSDDSLNIIMQMCINATSYTGTKTLKYIGLTSEQATKCTTLSNYSAFTNAGWTTGY